MYRYFDLLAEVHNTAPTIISRGLETKELIEKKLSLDTTNLYSVDSVRELPLIKKYLFGELSWYFSGSRDVDDIAKYSKFWNKIKNEDGTVNSNYGHLVFYKSNKYCNTQYNWVKDQLIIDQFSRKAVILYNDKDLYYYNNKDFCCTQLQQFFIRNGKLHSIIYIRSSDMIKGLTFDIPFWSIVQQQLLFDLKDKYGDLELGGLSINIGSVHIYKNDLELVKNMINSNNKRIYQVKLKEKIELHYPQSWYEKNIEELVVINEK